MPAASQSHTVASHFTKSTPAVRKPYEAILKAARGLGTVHEDPKKTSIHLVRDTVFAGVATRKEGLILTLKAERPSKSPRVHRCEQASANRWHLEVRLTAPSDVDAELKAWLSDAYDLASR
jgi:uncharacterized protein DUF5655